MMDGEVYRTFILAKHDGNTGLPIYMARTRAPTSSRRRGRDRASRRLDARALPQDLPDGDDPLHEGRCAIEGYLYWTLVDDVHPRVSACTTTTSRAPDLDTDCYGQPSGRSTAPGLGAPQRRQADDRRRLREGVRRWLTADGAERTLRFELMQRREAGHDTTGVEDAVRAALDGGSPTAIRMLTCGWSCALRAD